MSGLRTSQASKPITHYNSYKALPKVALSWRYNLGVYRVSLAMG